MAYAYVFKQSNSPKVVWFTYNLAFHFRYRYHGTNKHAFWTLPCTITMLKIWHKITINLWGALIKWSELRPSSPLDLPNFKCLTVFTTSSTHTQLYIHIISYIQWISKVHNVKIENLKLSHLLMLWFLKVNFFRLLDKLLNTSLVRVIFRILLITTYTNIFNIILRTYWIFIFG